MKRSIYWFIFCSGVSEHRIASSFVQQKLPVYITIRNRQTTIGDKKCSSQMYIESFLCFRIYKTNIRSVDEVKILYRIPNREIQWNNIIPKSFLMKIVSILTIFTYSSIVEKVLNVGQIFEIEILMDLRALRLAWIRKSHF